MASTTSIDGRTRSLKLGGFFGLACLTGGLMWLVFNLAEALALQIGPPVADGLFGAVLLVGLMGGPLGLFALQAAGKGRAGRFGTVGLTMALLGLCSDLVGHSLQWGFGFATEEIGVFYAAGALLVGLGMLTSEIVILVARRLPGWRRFAPLSVGAYYAAMIPVQAVFFIVPNGTPSATLLAFWGLTWSLLGYAIFSEARDR